MSLSVTHLAAALQTLLTTDAEEAARDTGFVKRKRQLTATVFVQTLVFGWLEDPQASLEDLTEVAAQQGATVTPQALDQRCTTAAADFLASVLDQAVSYTLAARPAAVALLRRFNGVYLQDSTTLSLPAPLAPLFPGCGGSTPRARA